MQDFFVKKWSGVVSGGPCYCSSEKHPMERWGPFARKPIASLEDSEGFQDWKSHPKHGGSEDVFKTSELSPNPKHIFWKSFWELKLKLIEAHQKSADSAKICRIMNSDFIDDKQQSQMYVSSDLCKMRETHMTVWQSIMPVKTIAT